MALRFNPPPHWPAPPAGWTPPAGWQPDAAWGPLPDGWNLWVDDTSDATEKARRSWFARHKVLTTIGAVLGGGGVGPGVRGHRAGAPTAAPGSPHVAPRVLMRGLVRPSKNTAVIGGAR